MCEPRVMKRSRKTESMNALHDFDGVEEVETKPNRICHNRQQPMGDACLALCNYSRMPKTYQRTICQS